MTAINDFISAIKLTSYNLTNTDAEPFDINRKHAAPVEVSYYDGSIGDVTKERVDTAIQRANDDLADWPGDYWLDYASKMTDEDGLVHIRAYLTHHVDYTGNDLHDLAESLFRSYLCFPHWD